MIENYNEFLLVCGVSFLFGAFAPLLFKRLPVSLPMLQVSFGIAMGYFWEALPFLDPLSNGTVVEKITEFVVLVSLVGAGIKIDTPLKWRYWRPTVRLLIITMPICIGVMAVLGYYTFGLSLAAAILLGAVLAPTDPVLASSIQVGPPNEGKQEDTHRFSLTSEAGLNDGLAFPFVYLAIAIAEASMDGKGVSSELLWSWFGYEVVWKILAGTVVGWAVGKVVAKFVFSKLAKDTALSQGYIIVALMLLSYGIAEFIHGYGFIAVFVAAFAFRRSECQHDYHQKLHDFAEQSEGLLMSLVLVTFGMVIGQAIGADLELTWKVYGVALLCLLIVRPVAGWLSLAGLGIEKREKFVISSLGIRGIGTFYYLSYALNKDVFDKDSATVLWIVCMVVVVMSIFIHGMSAPKLMEKQD